jgi:hypothetical protein
MASAQLIKHSFNRERELLADATSVQLTRSPAIMETLKSIHQDTLGSRLTGIADINGLSHFFFASSGADLGDVSWFATHPSLAERMSAINANAYHDFAVQVAKEKRLNQQKIKEIYEQRRLGDWGVIVANSLSNNKQEKNAHQSRVSAVQSASDIYKTATDKNRYSADRRLNSNFNDIIEKDAIEKEIATFSTSEINNELQDDNGLEFVIEQDVVIDGRLQVQAQDIGTHQLLKPWQAKPDSDLPSDTLIGIEDIQKVSLPQYVLNHSYHPLGAQALIESVLLCHQGYVLSTTATYDLTDIWLGLDEDGTSAAETDTSGNTQILPHTLDHKLLAAVANLDRRLNSALIALALKQLRQHNLSENAIDELRLKYEASHSNQDHQYYVQQKKCRTMLLRYQQGIIQLFENSLTADLSQNIADTIDNDASIDKSISVLNPLENTRSRSPAILALWQALQLQQLLPVLSAVLNDTQVQSHLHPQYPYYQWQQVLHAGTDDIYAQLDPSGQVFNGLDVAARTMLTLLAYRLSKDAKGQIISALDSSVPISVPISTLISVLSYNSPSVAHYLVDLRRHARLIDIDLAAVSEANLQWLLLTAQSLNTVQLLALIEAVPIFIASASQSSSPKAKGDDNYRQRQQGGAQIDYNAHIQDGNADRTDSVDKAGNDSTRHFYTYHTYRQWLSTLHTVMLHDTIVSQDEYDCLTELANHWLGVRQLF